LTIGFHKIRVLSISRETLALHEPHHFVEGKKKEREREQDPCKDDKQII
jgi:hypothetical protein